MAYYLIKTCYGCGVTLTREKLSEAEAIQYVKDIQTFLSQVGRVDSRKRSIILYDGLCAECEQDILRSD